MMAGYAYLKTPSDAIRYRTPVKLSIFVYLEAIGAPQYLHFPWREAQLMIWIRSLAARLWPHVIHIEWPLTIVLPAGSLYITTLRKLPMTTPKIPDMIMK